MPAALPRWWPCSRWHLPGVRDRCPSCSRRRSIYCRKTSAAPTRGLFHCHPVAWWVRASKPSFDDQSYDSARAGSLQMSGYASLPCAASRCHLCTSSTHALPGRATPPSSGQPNGVLFVCCLLFCLLTVLFGAFLVWGASPDPSRPAARAAAPEGQMTRSERLSQATTASWGMFRRWGTWLASHPVSVILISAVVTNGDPHSQGRPNYTYVPPTRQEELQRDPLHGCPAGPAGPAERLQGSGVGERRTAGCDTQGVSVRPPGPQLMPHQCCCGQRLRQYFQNTPLKNTTKNSHLSDAGSHLDCSPLSFKDITNLQLSCMADYGAPVFPFLAVGGYTGEDYSEAQALILTFSLNNYPRSDLRYAWVLLWEQRFLQVVGEFQQTHAHTYTIAYMAERSLEDEINRTTAEDIPIFAISYLVIFLYIALALGEYSSCRRILVDSKVTLGLGGILVVLGAVFSSMGFYAYVGLPSSLVIIEVVPFLVLAVGADNIFIFVLEYQRSVREPGERREQHIGRVLGTVAPSMLLCSFSEATCFFLGSLTRMPAVRTFALNAALAVLFDFLLQMSMFVALVSLDARRQEAARLDLCCCHRLSKAGCPARSEGLLRPFMRLIYTPVLLNCAVRALVVSGVGGEGKGGGPGDSYMVQYFQYLNQYFMVGLPTYFVTTGGYNFSTGPGMNGVCSSAGCDNSSLTQKIQYATRFPNVSYLAIPASSWVDDFIDWLHPLSRCCRISSSDSQFCPSTNSSCPLSCMRNLSEVIRPSVEQFNHFLPWFLHDMPNLNCPKGGLGAYDTAVKLGPDGEIQASRFMAYHTPLTNSQEYTAALRAARALATNITNSMRRVPGTDPNFRVFPYTVTYVFYEQYLTIVNEGLFNLALCLVPTFAVCCVLLGMDLRSGLINLLTILMILVDTVGAMTLWDISYNAISLINLVTAVGISVEFVSHLTRAFAVSTQPTRLERAKEATINMGSAVFAGVAMTNLPGIVVLAFAKAQLIQIFFFRLNLLITLLGLLHGLVFLPVLLSYFAFYSLLSCGLCFLCPKHNYPAGGIEKPESSVHRQVPAYLAESRGVSAFSQWVTCIADGP
uniref:NPC1 like intracellular cholesterol transporter 1 n=1 Tax=Chelonoidis abingdonii TaxID=106734 RepID=A0A8C0ISS6_CHEAB